MPSSADEQFLDVLAGRSDPSVLRMTMGFAIGGAIMDLLSHALASFFPGASVGMLWGIWIPLCFLTIPSLHYLARKLLALQTRIAALEAALAHTPTPSSH